MKRFKLKRNLAAIAALVGAFAGGGAMAIPINDPFELDSDAIATTFPDWDRIFCDSISDSRLPGHLCEGTPVSNAIVSSFVYDVVDGSNANPDNIFNGAKDTLDIAFDLWAWKNGPSANAKNDIEHGFAAVYAKDGKLYLYFGLDKLANNGDAALGFWFVQQGVSPAGNVGGNNALDFLPNNAHKNGDILIQADVTNGGGIPRYEVFTWGPNSGDNAKVGNSNLFSYLQRENVDCSAANVNDLSCAIMNLQEKSVPFSDAWKYIYKGPGQAAQQDVFAPATFFEGGLELTGLFGSDPGALPCLSSMIVETRQSQAETAELEDFVIADFKLCSLNVKKEAAPLSKAGDQVEYTITITNDGSLPLNKKSITDSLQGDLTGQAPSECDVLNPNQSCSFTYTRTVNQAETNTVTAVYSRGADNDVQATDSHVINTFTPALTIDKKAKGPTDAAFTDTPVSILQGEEVDYQIKVTNTTAAGAPNLACTITDTKLGINTQVVLASGESTTVTGSKTFTSLADLNAQNQFTNTATASCQPQGHENRVNRDDSVTVTVIPRQITLVVDKTGDAFSKPSDPVSYTFTITTDGNEDITIDSIIDDKLGNLVTNSLGFVTENNCPAVLPAGPQSCTIKATRTTQVGDPDPYVNTVTVSFHGTFSGADQDTDTHSVDLVHPAFTISKTCTPDTFPAGSSVNFTIKVANTGDVDLVTRVTDGLLSIDTTQTLAQRSKVPCAAGDFANGLSDWSDGCWQIDGSDTFEDSVTNTATADVSLPQHLGLGNTYRDTASDTCEAEKGGDATRTQGFWKTHGSDDDSDPKYGFTCHVFESHLGGHLSLAWTQVNNCEDLFGVFWANSAKLSTGKPRDAICRDELHASTQLLAALLNEGLTNGADIPTINGVKVSELLIAAMGACHDSNSATVCDVKKIKQYGGILGGYNESGDDVSIVDVHSVTIPNADPNGMKDVMDKVAGDCKAAP